MPRARRAQARDVLHLSGPALLVGAGIAASAVSLTLCLLMLAAATVCYLMATPLLERALQQALDEAREREVPCCCCGGVDGAEDCRG